MKNYFLKTINNGFSILKETFVEFFKEKTFIHSAALSYYTVLTLVPILYLSIVSFGQLIGQKMMVEIISNFLNKNIGIQDVSGIIDFLNQIDFEKSNLIMQSILIITLLVSCSALFNSLKHSINDFFDIEKEFHSRKKKIISSFSSRLRSILLLAFFGLIVILTYFSQTVIISIGTKFFSNLSLVQHILVTIIQHLLSILSNVIIFLFVFKYLHDAIVSWKMAFIGSCFTSFLLYFGQLLIKYYLTNYFFARDSGLAGTILVILVWMYYSSQIIFLGAKFTAVFAKRQGNPILVD